MDESVLTGYSIPMAPGSGLTSAYTNTLLSGSQATATSLPSPSTMTTTTTTIPATTAHVSVSRRTLSPEEQAEYDAFNKNQQTRSNSSRFTAATIDDTVYAAIPGPPPRFQAPSTTTSSSTTSINNNKSSSSNDDVAITKSIAFDQSAYTRNNKDDGGDDSHDGGGGSHIVANPSAPMSSEGLYKLPDLPAPITSQKDSASSSSSSSLGLHLPEPPSMKENDLFDALQSRLAALQSGNDDPKTQE